jgi:gamma-glutamylcyclotransferase (GGCT)/AIG2-like uncharacterized protein YtfP
MVMTEVAACRAIIPGQGQDMAGQESSMVLESSMVFVYGSLKRDQANHHWMAGATWLGEASLDGVQLFDLGPFPMAVEMTPSPELSNPLRGELYQVNGSTLTQLDQLEGAPRLFQRHWRSLRDGRGAWVYLGRAAQVRHVPQIPSGHWSGPPLARWRRAEPMA